MSYSRSKVHCKLQVTFEVQFEHCATTISVMSAEDVIIRPEALEDKIKAGVPNCTFVRVLDLSDGCGSKFDITVVSSEFMGKAIIAQHRLVNKAIEEERKHIHAVTVKTKTPESWQQENEPEET